jgi:bifunctional UDP-N-acetylglucosamine pyrophosphorylase/glucosamine-1-phosphate N-acetyltransferase
VVRDRARLGCNTVLIAPVTVGRGAKTGAGAVVCARKNIPPGKTAVGVPARVLGKNEVN